VWARGGAPPPLGSFRGGLATPKGVDAVPFPIFFLNNNNF
jgi:hypothetical protein